MNVNRFKEIIELLLAAEQQHSIQQLLQQLRNEFQQLVNQPQNPQVQTAVAATLERLRKTFLEMRIRFTPAQWSAFHEIKATELFLEDITQIIEKRMADNPITPAATLNTINDLANKRSEYLNGLRELQNRLTQLGITATQIPAGSAEIGVLLPRTLFQNHLSDLASELRVLNRILRAVSELTTGSIEPVEVNEISTSDPIFFLGVSIPTIVMFGKLVAWALDTWKKVEDIRKVRAETQKIGAFTDSEIKTFFESKVEKTIKDCVEAKVNELVPKKSGAGRSHEQRTDLAWALESILSRVERGMTVEVRFLPPPKPKDAAEKEQSTALQELAAQLSFPPADASPILPLPPPDPPSAAAD